MEPDIPFHLNSDRQALLREAIANVVASQDDNLLGVVLSGSAARAMDTDRSDLDVLMILERQDQTNDLWIHRLDLEVIPITLEHLETIAPFGSSQWGYRWSYGWAPVLLDRTGGRIAAAIDRQTHLSDEEANDILVDRQLLGAWINQLYRALKSARKRRDFEARVDSAESVGQFLDVLFALHGMVRPYSSYLRWALREHPLPGWPEAEVMRFVGGMLAADPALMREAYARIQGDCLAFDARVGGMSLRDEIDGWSGSSYDDLREALSD